MNYIKYLDEGGNTEFSNYNRTPLDVKILPYNPQSERWTPNIKNTWNDFIRNLSSIFKETIHNGDKSSTFGTASVENNIGKFIAPGQSSDFNDYRITGAAMDDLGITVYLQPRS